MSAPDTNIHTQTRRHRPSLGGIALVAGFAAIALFTMLAVLADRGNTPGDDTPAVRTESG